MKKALLFFFGFGLLPIWVAIVAALMSWNLMSHWYIIFAIPWCGITMGIVAITLIVYYLVPVNESKRFILASIIFTVLVGVTLYMTFGKHYSLESRMKQEKVLVQDFVKHNEEVIKKAKGIKEIFSDSYNRKSQKDLPFRYIVHVYGSEKEPWEKGFESLYVFVDVLRQKDVPEFKIACMEFSSNHVAPLSIISGHEPCGESCLEGRINCSGVCVPSQVDEKNCGGCNRVCPKMSSCSHGQCMCVPGLNNCSNNCVNLKKDDRNCGACGTVCPEGSFCNQGKCAMPGKTH